MHIKFINTGKGSAGAAKEYLLREHDHKGEIRESVQVLRGNPDQVTAVAESLEFKHTYRSAVIAWHKDDRPTPDQVQEVLDDFERVAFAGLEPNQYTYYAVWHGEADGSGHIHIITPRVELQTGKSLNIAPPGWQKTYDLIRDKFNTKYDWASPGEKSRQRLAVQGKIELHADTPRNEAKKMINAAVIDRIEAGLIRNHADVKSYLGEIGEITREGKDYISVKPNGFKKAIRLKGAAYEREFSIERVGEAIRAEKRARSGSDLGDRREEVERIESAITQTIEQRAKYNRGRYAPKRAADRSSSEKRSGKNHRARKASAQRGSGSAGRSQNKNDRVQLGHSRKNGRNSWRIEQTQADIHSKTVDISDADRDRSRGRTGDRIMESWSVRINSDQNDGGTEIRDIQVRRNQAKIDEVPRDHSLRRRNNNEKQAKNISDKKRQLGGALENGGELNDRIRERITSYSQDATESIRREVARSSAGKRTDQKKTHRSILERFVRDRKSCRARQSKLFEAFGSVVEAYAELQAKAARIEEIDRILIAIKRTWKQIGELGNKIGRIAAEVEYAVREERSANNIAYNLVHDAVHDPNCHHVWSKATDRGHMVDMGSMTVKIKVDAGRGVRTFEFDLKKMEQDYQVMRLAIREKNEAKRNKIKMRR